MPPSAPRSLTDDLRRRDDDALARLLQRRPDLASPTPVDLTALASRASTRVSVYRALTLLDRPTLDVAEALVALRGPVRPAEIARACGTTAARLGPLLGELRDLALAWGDSRSVWPVRAMVDLLGPHPAGLGPWLVDTGLARSPSRMAGIVADLGLTPTGDPHGDLDLVSGAVADPAVLARLLDTAPPQARELLERLDASGPLGALRVTEPSVRGDQAVTAPGWLLAHGLLVAPDDEHVVLPREVATSLRGGRVHRDGIEPELTAPDLVGTQRDLARVDAQSAAAAADVVRLVGELAALWEAEAVPVLRGGGVGVRDLRRTSAALRTDDTVTARVMVVAGAAGLVGEDGRADPRWAPTAAFDRWAEESVGTQWELLARGWSEAPASASTVGTRGDRGTVRAALSEAVLRPAEALLRREVLAALAQASPGTAVSTEALRSHLAWRRPRGPVAAAGSVLPAVVGEAGWLGVLGLGALSSAGRALAEGAGAAAAALDALLPTPVDHVLLQADLTAVAPGPLTREVERELSLMADVDSRGGATVYRLGPDSVRRALDAGRTADELLTFLAQHSRTPVPQPVDYLVHDTARRHGRIKVGAASSFVRSDDPTVLTELLADRRSDPLRLRRLAPTVLSAQADPTTVLATLRRIGLAPAAEGHDGGVVLHRRGGHRAASAHRPASSGSAPGAQGSPVDEASATGLVRALRAADRGESPTRSTGTWGPGSAGGTGGTAGAGGAPSVPVLDPATSLARLRSAAAGLRAVWVGISDPLGTVDRRLLEPLSVEGGRVSALDVAAGTVRTLSVHRVTGVADAPAAGRFSRRKTASRPEGTRPDAPEER